jgi:hypothetical protein
MTMPGSTSISRILLSVSCLVACVSTTVRAQDNGVEQVANWQAYLEDHSDTSKYRLVFEWDHIHDATIFVDGVDGGRVYNAEDDERCNGDSSIVASDGQPYWMPRFFPRPVSAEITAVTGVKFASADWQPCGHKEITICHAESHYDFHMYYEDEETMNSLPLCEIGVPSNPDLPVCRDSATSEINHDYFRLVNHSIPLTMSMSRSDMETTDATTTTLLDGVQKNFCVDASSAILRSGVHYGDASETLDEWKNPVTIIGSHNCELKFFEPMFSWKWASGCVTESETSWPVFEVANIEYTKKGIESLPDSWKIEVSEACKAQSCFPGQMDPPQSEVCHIKLSAEGTKCPPEGCTLLKECGNMNDCSTGLPYLSPWTGNDEDNVDNPVVETTSTPAITKTAEPQPTSPPAVTEKVNTSSDAAVFVNGAKSLLLVALTSMAFLY